MDYEKFKEEITAEALKLGKDDLTRNETVKLHWAAAESKIELALWYPRRIEVMWVGVEKYAVAVIHKGIMVQYLLVDGGNDTITYDERAWKHHYNAYDIADNMCACIASYTGYKPRRLAKFAEDVLNALDDAKGLDGDVEGLRSIVARAARRAGSNRKG